jgi:hypothetical protein
MYLCPPELASRIPADPDRLNQPERRRLGPVGPAAAQVEVQRLVLAREDDVGKSEKKKQLQFSFF